MRRRLLALLSGGVVIALVTGAGTAAAPGMPGPHAVSKDKGKACKLGEPVTVGWVLDADITQVRAVEVGNLPGDCQRQKIRVTILDDTGNELSRIADRDLGTGPSVVVDLDASVPAAAIAHVDLVVAGNSRN